MEDSSDTAVQMGDQEDQTKGYTNQKYGPLDKVCPEYGFQTACLGVNNFYDTHDYDQDIYVDSHKAG